MSPDLEHDGELRHLLHDAVSDVRPRRQQPAPDRSGSSGGKALTATVLAAAVVALVIVGTAWFADRPVGGGGGPAVDPSQRTRTAAVTVFYLGATPAGPRLFQETHRVTGVATSDLEVAVNEALSGTPSDPDYAPGFPHETATAHVTTDGNMITIDLSQQPGATVRLAPGRAHLAVQALVWTADAALSSRQPVRFLVSGKPVPSLHGVDTSRPIERDSVDSVLSTVNIQTPTEGQTVRSGFTVYGLAATFEANVVWELERGSHVVRHGFTTARQCCVLSPYSFTVSAPPGDYTLVVHDVNESNGEGVGAGEDTKDVTVR